MPRLETKEKEKETEKEKASEREESEQEIEREREERERGERERTRFIVSLQRESITYTYENVRTSYARARIGTVWRTMRGRQRRRSFFSTRGSSQVETSTSNIGIGIP